MSERTRSRSVAHASAALAGPEKQALGNRETQPDSQLTHAQCDETHPACNNCHKSKRECLGYDPIFKRQPGPAPIQPAPSSQPPSSRDKPVFSSAPPVALMPQPRNPHPPTNHSIDSSFANSASLDPALAAAANYHPGDMPQDHYQLDLDPARKGTCARISSRHRPPVPTAHTSHQ